MMESGKNEFIGKKSYEIAYALWRIGTHAEEGVFANKLFDKAIELVGCAADLDYPVMGKIIGSLEMVIKFAVDVNCISISNAAILVRELGSLKAAISESAMNGVGGNSGDVDIADIFSSENMEEEETGEVTPGVEFMEEIPLNDFLANEVHRPQEPQAQEVETPETGKKAEMRQAAIFERIQQIGDCRLGDIQAILPDVSERTLRYDIESLVQRNLIERLGTGGRSVYYRIRPLVNEA